MDNLLIDFFDEDNELGIFTIVRAEIITGKYYFCSGCSHTELTQKAVSTSRSGLFLFMANRVLRDWTQSETVDNLSPEAERFFTRLIMKADDYGCFYGNPKLLKAALFPLKDINNEEIATWRDQCVMSGLLKLYQDDGKEYIQILNFGQRLRTMASKFPLPADNSLTTDGVLRTIDSNSPPETKRNETKEKDNAQVFVSKENAFESIRDNEQFMEESQRTLSGRGWRSADKVDVLAVLSAFLNGKADLTTPQGNVRQHFKNWIIREKIENLQTFAQVFKHSQNGRQKA